MTVFDGDWVQPLYKAADLLSEFQKDLGVDYNPTAVGMKSLAHFHTVGGVAQLVRTSVYDRRTLPALRHDVQLTGDLLGVNRPLYVSQHGKLSHSSS